MIRLPRTLAALLLLATLGAPALAVNPDEILPDPALEARARDISRDLRCLVCQNQSIDDSDAELARDLRLLVRERLVAGDTDEEVEQYLVDRYGEFVLLNPVMAPHTLALWLAAPAIFALGLAGLGLVLLRRKRAKGDAPTPLSAEEQAALDALKDD